MSAAVITLDERRRRKKLAAMPHDPTKRGYSVVYRRYDVNRCPGCGHSNWHVGRITAECAFCSTAIPLGGEG